MCLCVGDLCSCKQSTFLNEDIFQTSFASWQIAQDKEGPWIFLMDLPVYAMRFIVFRKNWLLLHFGVQSFHNNNKCNLFSFCFALTAEVSASSGHTYESTSSITSLSVDSCSIFNKASHTAGPVWTSQCLSRKAKRISDLQSESVGLLILPTISWSLSTIADMCRKQL